MLSLNSLGVPAFLVLFLVVPAFSRTWRIAPDGTGDAPTIQAGIDSAQVGDTVLLACGDFVESGLSMKSGVTLRGETVGCATVHAGGPGTILTALAVDNARVEGIRFADGDGGGSESAIVCSASSVLFADCEFTGNRLEHGAGAAMREAGGSVTLLRCAFLGNVLYDFGHFAELRGGALAVHDGASLVAVECVFSGNYGYGSLSVTFGGAVWTGGDATSWFSDCLFTDNIAELGGAVCSEGQASFERCEFRSNGGSWSSIESFFGSISLSHTFVHHNASGLRFEYGGGTIVGSTIVANGGGVLCNTTLSMERSIVAFNGGAAFAGNGAVGLSCCDVFENTGGDYVGPAAGQGTINGNLWAWPLFCDPANSIYYLSGGSPCLPAGNSCGVQIGAFGKGCGPISVEPLSWGEVKALYR